MGADRQGLGREGGLNMAIGASEVEAAAGRINGHIRKTPALVLGKGAFGLAFPIALKLESLQASGTFKARGAFHKLLLRRPPAAGVIAASGGNHGAAIAYAARALGHKAEIFVPTLASAAKVQRLRDFGATVNQIGAVYTEAREASIRRAQETGAITVEAYDDPEVFAGAGTIAREFAEQAGFDTLLVAVGGGGLISGCVAALGGRAKIVAVETDGTPTLNRALAAGRPVDVSVSGLAVDALGASRIGTSNFEQVKDRVGSVLVTDDDLRRAQRALWNELRIIAEPAGAAGLAALMAGAYRPASAERVAVLVCGGNTDPASLA